MLPGSHTSHDNLPQLDWGAGGNSEREDRIEKCLGYCIKRILWSFQFESNFQLPGQRNQVMGDGALSFN